MRLKTGLLLTAAIGAFAWGADVNAARPRRPVWHPSITEGYASTAAADLLDARSHAAARRFRQAEISLGRAETRLLDASASPATRPPYLQRALTDVAAARENAARSQRDYTLRFINDALLSLEPRQLVEAPVASVLEPAPLPLMPPPSITPLAEAAPPPPAPPAILYRQEAGHWTLRGAESVWVPAETVPRPVSVATVVPTREVWNGDRWVLVPEHFARVSP